MESLQNLRGKIEFHETLQRVKNPCQEGYPRVIFLRGGRRWRRIILLLHSIILLILLLCKETLERIKNNSGNHLIVELSHELKHEVPTIFSKNPGHFMETNLSLRNIFVGK